MKNEVLELSDLLQILRRYSRFILVTVALCTAAFLATSFLLSKRYKSFAVISIYTKYFQNPLVRDFLPEIYEASELRAQRESLIRQAFDPDYLDRIGEKHGLFTSSPKTELRAIERETLLKSIEIYSVQTTSFHVGFTGKTAESTYQITQDILSRVTNTLAAERRKTIERLRDSIRKRVETISLTFQSTADPLASVRPEILKKELERLEAQINALRTQYTDQHPQVSKLLARASLIRSWLNKTPGNIPPAAAKGRANSTHMPPEAPALIGGEQKEATLQVYEDLLKKLNYLNIVLEMEKDSEDNYVGVTAAPTLPTSPIWPRKSLFAFWGLATGILLSFFIVLLREYFERMVPSIEDFSQKLNVSYLGSIPRFHWASDPKPGPGSPTRGRPRTRTVDEWN